MGNTPVPVPPGASFGPGQAQEPAPVGQPQPVPAGATFGEAVSPSGGTTGPTGVLGVLSGIGGGMFETAQGAKNLVNKALPSSMQIPDISEELRKQRTPSEKFGGGIETVGEFIAGDEALKGLDLASRLGLATKVAQIAQSSPRLARAIEIGMTALRSGFVGGAQGGVEAAGEGKPVLAGAEAGAAGGAIGSAVGEGVIAPGISKAGEGLQRLGPKFGNALLMANKVKNFQYGKNPGRVFADEGITAKPWESYADVEKSLQEAGEKIKAEALGIISQSRHSQDQIQVIPQIHQIFDNALDEVSEMSAISNTERKALIADIDDLRPGMTEKFDRRGNSLGQKGPMTPAEIARFKTKVGNETKWDPTKSVDSNKFLNNLRKKVYASLDNAVDTVMPEMKDINARWANQIEAEMLIKGRVAQEQAAAYGRSKGVARAVLGAGLAMIHAGDAEAGGALILNEAARFPGARVALARGGQSVGKALEGMSGEAIRKGAAAFGAEEAKGEEEP